MTLGDTSPGGDKKMSLAVKARAKALDAPQSTSYHMNVVVDSIVGVRRENRQKKKIPGDHIS